MQVTQGSAFLEMLTTEKSASHTHRDRLCDGAETTVVVPQDLVPKGRKKDFPSCCLGDDGDIPFLNRTLPSPGSALNTTHLGGLLTHSLSGSAAGLG